MLTLRGLEDPRCEYRCDIFPVTGQKTSASITAFPYTFEMKWKHEIYPLKEGWIVCCYYLSVEIMFGLRYLREPRGSHFGVFQLETESSWFVSDTLLVVVAAFALNKSKTAPL